MPMRKGTSCCAEAGRQEQISAAAATTAWTEDLIAFLPTFLVCRGSLATCRSVFPLPGGERVRVRGFEPIEGAKPPHPTPLPRKGVHARLSTGYGGEGADRASGTVFIQNSRNSLPNPWILSS